MIKFAITGNIASGKSETEKIISDLGYKILDTDCVAHQLLENNNYILEAFKDFDILDNGQISRGKLGKIVFYDSEMKSKLENILHPEIKKEIEKFFHMHAGEKAVFVSVPLLFEAKMDDIFDKIIFIYAEDKIRLERLLKRNHYTEEYALKRINSQIPQEEKLNKSDFVIFNNSSVEILKNQILICLKEFS